MEEHRCSNSLVASDAEAQAWGAGSGLDTLVVRRKRECWAIVDVLDPFQLVR